MSMTMTDKAAEAYYKEQLEKYDFNGQKIPERMHESVIRYVVHHVQPGSFLSAVFSNDLREAVAWADMENRLLLPAYTGFAYMHMPHNCCGSRENFQEWLIQGKEDG